MATKVIACKCDNSYQDKEYGPKKRLHNICVKGWRCTVCRDLKERGK